MVHLPKQLLSNFCFCNFFNSSGLLKQHPTHNEPLTIFKFIFGKLKQFTCGNRVDNK